MTSSLPDPLLPEHELIRAADELPELSPSLRSATLLVCDGHIRRARRVRRLRRTAIVLAVVGCTVAVLISRQQPPPDDPAHSPVAEERPAPVRVLRPSPGRVGSPGSPGKVFSVDGTSSQDAEQLQISRDIEALRNRSRSLINGSFLPFL